MLPKELSEDVCSLQPNVLRLCYVCKIVFNNSYEIIEEKFFEAFIVSKRRFTYKEVDEYLIYDKKPFLATDAEILKYLIPLYELTQKFKRKRIKKGFDFLSDEIKISLNKNMEIEKATIQAQTPAHSLIEECMLLANKAAAKMFKYGIFRTHEHPEAKKIENVIKELMSVGIFPKKYSSLHKTILSIQQQAQELGIRKEVDKLIIKALKQASYTATNIGHFGLGFKKYTHFTSPIRRYADLMLHRLLKAIQKSQNRKKEYILRNIEPLTVKISELEREENKVEWDFTDRKFARWAQKNIGKEFHAIIATTKVPTAIIEDKNIAGARIFIENRNIALFERVKVKIEKSDIATAKIYGSVISKEKNV